MMWFPIVTGLLLVWAGIVAVIIVLQRRSAAATLAWLMVLAFLPVLGLIVYRVIGPLRLERKKLKREASRRVVGEAMKARALLEDQLLLEHRQLAHVAIGLGESPPLRAGELEVLLDGNTAYDALLAAVDASEHHVHLEYYIWEPDIIGTRLRDRLIARAKAGVEVRMIVDGTGSSKLTRKFLAPLRAAGVKVAWFNPIRVRFFRVRRPDFRTHRKIVVCDGRVAFTGGMNITDSHSEALCKDYWRDTHLRLTGAAVWPLQRMFLEDWYFAAEQLIAIDEATFPQPATPGEHLVQIVGSGPDSYAFAVHKVVFTAMNQSSDRLWVTTPYLVPDDALLSALVTAALRGCDVRLLVPRKGDSRLVDLAARSYFAELLAAGVKIYEYQPRFIHAKTMVCDGDVTFIGTANLDNRSFRLNFEVVAVIYGEATNAILAEAFLADLRDSREVIRSEFDAQSFGRRLSQASARLLSPLL
jgi:cardiolipin synthase